MIFRRSSTSTSTGMPLIRFCSVAPAGEAWMARSKYRRGRQCGKTSIFTRASRVGAEQLLLDRIHLRRPHLALLVEAHRARVVGNGRLVVHGTLAGPLLEERVDGRQLVGVLPDGLQRRLHHRVGHAL